MRKLVLSLFALLGVVLGAHGQPESWKYVGDNYSATEHIVYVGLVDDSGGAVGLNTYSDWIGAFIDGECRGVAAAASAQQLSYFPLRIKGTEADNGKPITFRYYQVFGNNPLEYSLTPVSELTYGNEQTTGTLSSLFALKFIQPLYFSFPETIEVRVGKTLNLMDQFTWEPANATCPINIQWDWANSQQYIKVENDVLTGLEATEGTYLGFSCLRDIKDTDDRYSTTVKVLPGLTSFSVGDVMMGRNSLETITLTPDPADAEVEGDKLEVRITNQNQTEEWTLATATKNDATGLNWTITPEAIGYGTIEVYYDGKQMGGSVLSIGQSFTQKEGWQWMTPYGGYADIQGTYGNHLQEIRSQTQVMYNDPEYGYFGDLAYLEPGKCYKVRIKDGESVDAFNLKADYSADAYEMQIGEKWNWVGLKYQFDHAIADAFNANSGLSNGDRIVSKDAGFAEYDGTAWTGTLTTLIAGEGYMIYNASEGKNIMPAAEIQLGKSSTADGAKMNGMRNSVWQYNSARFASNMSIIADLGEEYASSRYSVGAFIDGECRGEGCYVGGKWFITVHGDANVKGQTVSFRIYDTMTDASYTIDDSLPFSQMAGKLSAPLRMTVDATTGISGVQNDAAVGSNAQYLSLDGRRLSGKPAHGVYIVKDGVKTRKVIVNE